MTSLTKQNKIPMLKSMMDDFWNNGGFFGAPFFNTPHLPAVNVRETDKHFELTLAAPGFGKENFKITAEDGLLTINAEQQNTGHEEADNYTRREFSSSSFSRTFTLPDNVVSDNIKAKYENGLLVIDLEKAATNLSPKKQITID